MCNHLHLHPVDHLGNDKVFFKTLIYQIHARLETFIAASRFNVGRKRTPLDFLNVANLFMRHVLVALYAMKHNAIIFISQLMKMDFMHLMKKRYSVMWLVAGFLNFL